MTHVVANFSFLNKLSTAVQMDSMDELTDTLDDESGMP